MTAYDDSVDHLQAELGRLDLLLRRYLEEWWDEPDGPGDELRGLYVSDETVDGLLRTAREGPRTVGSQREEHELTERIETAAAEIRADEQRAIAAGRDLPLVRLADRFDLTRRHRDALLLCLAPELDSKYETVYSYLQDDVTKTQPRVGFLLRVLCRSDRERLETRSLFSQNSPLVQHRLVALSVGEEQPRPSRVVTGDERIVDYLLGNDRIAEELADVAEVRAPAGTTGDPLGDTARSERLGALVEAHQSREDSTPSMTYFHGPYGSGKEAAALAMCADTGTSLVKADAEAIVERDVPATIRLLAREAALRDAPLFVSGLPLRPDDGDSNVGLEALLGHLDAFDGPVFLSSDQPLPPRLHLQVEDHEVATLHFPPPSYEARKDLWRRVDGLPDDVDAADLAAKFRFTSGQISDAVSTAHLLSNGEGLTVDSLYQGCRAQSGETLTALAQGIEPTYTWDDIVLPADKLRHLREVATHITHQGRVYSDWGFEDKFSLGNGLNVLFTGPSGTGKTMAAEIIAEDAGLDLYKIDLSSVVSKYIGETEKNLRKIFDEAEETDAILLFDEADALFGKRSAVKDSHDRYANIEVNYLLQRVEEHDGTVILTTNFKQNIDDAFLRRIHLSVDFPRPNDESRAAIWDVIFPDETPVDGLDVEFLSSFEITGGNIKNIALTAAFMAAEDECAVGMEHVVRAIRREFQKTGKLVRPEEFGRYRHLLT